MDFHEVAAALRHDATDLATYARVLVSMLDDALPGESVTVTRSRGLADRMRGREGPISEVVVRLGERVLSLTASRDRPLAEVRHEVRGVTLSREPVSLDRWLELLARELVVQAESDAKAAHALRRLVAGAVPTEEDRH
jgi:hypothetical protein